MRRIRRRTRSKTTQISVAEEFYDAIENARRSFEKQYGLNNLKTTAFTRMLAKKGVFKKYETKKKKKK